MNNRITTILLAAVLVVASGPSFAQRADEPGTWEMAADAVVARPFGAAITTLGIAVFVVSLPFSALGGNVANAADALVVEPAKATFMRCLGCRTSGRHKSIDK